MQVHEWLKLACSNLDTDACFPIPLFDVDMLAFLVAQVSSRHDT